jgi:hypothetical protein
VEQVNLAVAQMDQVTQSNAANAEETAAASEELSSQAIQLNDAVGNLERIAGGSSNGKRKAVSGNGGNGALLPAPHIASSFAPMTSGQDNLRDKIEQDDLEPSQLGKLEEFAEADFKGA